MMPSQLLNHGKPWIQWDHFNIGKWMTEWYSLSQIFAWNYKQITPEEGRFSKRIARALQMHPQGKCIRLFASFSLYVFSRIKRLGILPPISYCFELSFLWWFTTIHKKDNIMYFILTKSQKSIANVTTNLLHSTS